MTRTKLACNYFRTWFLLLVCVNASADPVIYINQVAFDARGPKIAIIQTEMESKDPITFSIVSAGSLKEIYSGKTGPVMQNADWSPGAWYYQADFSAFRRSGIYLLQMTLNGRIFSSQKFEVAEKAMAKMIIPSIIHYYNKQRANTAAEWKADEKLLLYESTKTVDLRGGWCDASGDVSKYFSHLAYANFMSPQQTPLVTWALINAAEALPHLLKTAGVDDSIKQEAIWGADYMMRALSPDDYFYMIVFSYFNKDPDARRVVGLLADSKTTADYQSAFREGGGMAIAALARISRWKQHGDYRSEQYLAGAKRAFAHLLVNNLRYDDDGKENIIDDYCALMAATELWITTGENLYRDEARKRAAKLENRISPNGYFIANGGDRPYWHASDAGLPVIALARYLDRENEDVFRAPALTVIRKALDYNLQVTHNVSNPFGYARQSFLFQGKVKDGFFIPHENETGWWWQGENARLASLATAAIIGGRLVYPSKNGWETKDSLADYASQQLSWILGCNPYSLCFLYGFGDKNVPYMTSNFGHGSGRGGISNGVTGKEGSPDGSGIDFKTEAQGNEWRWTEQWLPHAAWFLTALAAIAREPDVIKK